jgi:hypothetical protein
MKKLVGVLIVIGFSSSIFAQDIFSMSMGEFYKIEQYENMFKVMKEGGKIDTARAMLVRNCFLQAKTDADKVHCECAAGVIDKADPRLIVYDSIVSYKSFQAKFGAKQSGDDEEYQRLKDLDSKRMGLSNLIKDQCEEI